MAVNISSKNQSFEYSDTNFEKKPIQPSCVSSWPGHFLPDSISFVAYMLFGPALVNKLRYVTFGNLKERVWSESYWDLPRTN